MNRLLVSLALLMVCSGVTAAPVRASCSEGHCEEFDIVEKKSIRTGTDGTLVWFRMRAWKQRALFFREGEKEETGSVFCSTRRPALISTEKELTAAVMLAPLSDFAALRAERFFAPSRLAASSR
jgi:hypothetical protein